LATLTRWLEAQQYERGYWEHVANRIAEGAEGQLEWYAWKAVELERRLNGIVDQAANASARVLEIGSGPIGIVSFLRWGTCVALDPLDDFYRGNSMLTKLRRPDVTYIRGIGESLPFEASDFSLVIVDNVIDHSQTPGKILDEVHRVLTKNGVLYLMVNIHPSWGAVLHRLAAAAYVDRGHPYTFTRNGIHAFLSRHEFGFLSEEVEDYYLAREKDRSSTRLIDKIKGYSGLSEYRYHAVCRRLERP